MEYIDLLILSIAAKSNIIPQSYKLLIKFIPQRVCFREFFQDELALGKLYYPHAPLKYLLVTLHLLIPHKAIFAADEFYLLMQL